MADRCPSAHQNTFLEEPTPWWQPLLLPLYVLTAAIYLTWRVQISFAAVFWFSIPLLIVELYNTITTVIHLYLTRTILHPVWVPPLEHRTVDAFIPTYNEPDDIVEMTTIGALNIAGIRQVFILDDGDRKSIRRLATQLGAQYLARGENSHAKAGNMNHGLAYSDAEFVLFLDCDHVPQPNFIERTLGYFQDENLAFVQTPQVFYNTDSIQYRSIASRERWNEQTMFYECIQPAKNRFNAGFFCGSGAILRRAAIDSVGGFATGTATEDIHTSLRLHAKGWNSIFLSEQLAHGIAPEDLKEYHQQRVRWGAGSLGLLFRTGDSPLVAHGLSFMQRLCYINSTNAYFYGGLIKLFYFTVPALILLSLPFQAYSGHVFLLQYMLIAFPFIVLSNVITYIYSRKTFHFLYTEQYNIANILSCIMALKGIVRVQKKFRVSVKTKAFRESHFAYTFIVGLFLGMLTADLFGVLYALLVLHMTIGTFVGSVFSVALLWNTVNLLITGSFVFFLYDFNRRVRREHPFIGSAYLVMQGEQPIGRLQSIGVRGATVKVAQLPHTEAIDLVIETNGERIPLVGQIVSCTRTASRDWLVNVTFEQLSLENRRDLVRYFFRDLVPGIFGPVTSMSPAA